VIRQFSERFPRIRVRVHDESAQDVLNLVLAAEAHFRINFSGAKDAEIIFEAGYEERHVLAMGGDQPPTRRKELNWKDMVGERYISVAKSCGQRSVIDAALAGVEKYPLILYEVNHVSGA